MMRRILLLCGVLSPLLYAAADALAGMTWQHYSFRDQTISELGAIGAPSRPLFSALLILVYLLLLAFGIGVWQSARGRPKLRVVGGLLVSLATLALTVGQFVPMQPRGTPQGLTGTLHLVEGAVAVLLLLVLMGYAAAAFGAGFRFYTVATIALMLGFGAWSGAEASRIAAGMATPWVGVKERIFWYSYQLWFALLAVTLLRERSWAGASSVAAVMKRHAVLIYFALVFVFSFGGIFLVAGPEAFPLRADRFESFGPSFYLAILAGPCISGLLLLALAEGRRGLKDLLSRLGRWRLGWSAYVFALLPALVMAGSALGLSLVSADFRPGLLDSTDKAGILLSALGPALLVGGLEEIGWTGFAVPHLRSRYGVLATGLIVGMVWGLWHLPLFWKPDTLSGPLPLAILVVQLFSWLPPFRVLMVWIHDRTRSLPLLMLMHAAVSFVALILSPETLAGTRLLISLLVTAAGMWLLLAAVGLAHRRQSIPAPRRTSPLVPSGH